MDKTPDPKSLVWTISKPSHRSSWQRAMRKLKKSHPDFLDVRFHDLRHEATSRFFELGLDAMRVRLITGHKTLSMLSRYTHLESRDLVGLIDKLQEK
jgi:integrase